MLTREQIDAHIALIGTVLDEFERGEADLSHCFRAHRRFEELRRQYRELPQSLAGHVEQLSALRKRFDQLLASRAQAVVDWYHDLSTRIRESETEKAYWREVLIQLAQSSGQADLAGGQARVQVRAVASRKLPPAQSPERERLVQLIREAGQWEQVSQLSSRRLADAVAGQTFDESLRRAIEELAPGTTIHHVSSRPVDQ